MMVSESFFVPSSTSRSSTLSSSSLLYQSSVAAQSVELPFMDFFVPSEERPNGATPVLFLHGLLGNKRNFASLAASLGNQLENPRRIMGVDLRNHGDAAPQLQDGIAGDDDMSYPNMAQDVLEFLNAQGLEKVVLVGHSMGGKVAQAMSLLHPHRVQGLVVLDIAPVQYTSKDPNWQAVQEIMQAMNAVEVEEGTTTKGEVDKQLQKAIPDPNLRAFVLTNFGRTGWKIPVHKIVPQLESIAGFDVVKSSESIKYEGDVYIIHGGQSRFVRSSHMKDIAQYFPNHMLTTIRGAGHWVHAEAPDDTIALLKRYLDR